MTRPEPRQHISRIARIDSEMLQRLDTYASQTGIPKARILRFALQNYLDAQTKK